VFEVVNSGTVPHSLEIEGGGLEKSTPRMAPGAKSTLALDLRPGSYEAYCPIGKGSHKMLGMMNHLTVGEMKSGAHETEGADEYGKGVKVMKVVGAGPVIQILPGPYPFADKAMSVIHERPQDQQADLLKKAQMGPYSNNVAK